MTPNPSPEGVPALITIWPQAARILGISRGAAYRAASRNELPLMPLGKRKLVITAKLAEKIGRPITASDLQA